MRPQRSALQRIIHLLLAVVFVTAAQGQALGVRHCILHDAVPGAVADGAGHDEGVHRDAPSASHAESDPHHHGGAPGGCMDDCQAGSSISGIRADLVSTDLDGEWTAAGPVDGRTAAFGPRHQPYELHLPNGPPLST